ncbi:hypothetical protein D3C72_1927880 [compost metagenome]
MDLFDLFFRNRKVVLRQHREVCKFTFPDVTFIIFFFRKPSGTFSHQIQSFFAGHAIGITHVLKASNRFTTDVPVQ